ncbi:MAG: YqiA/YcfP family alpha/beta fold hydrolase [Betaproteobacteria bacterium]
MAHRAAAAPVPTLVYLHGFRSSPGSVKAMLFAAAIAALPAAIRPRLHVPALDPRPAAAVASVAAWVEREVGVAADERLTFVGSSLGGYYATHLAERAGARAVLINPAVRPYDDLRPYAGTQTNLHTGEAFEVTETHFAELRALKVARITRPDRYFLLVESGDEVLDWREAVAFYGGAFQYVGGGGDHAFRGFAAQIPAILRFAGVDVSAAS